MKLLLGLVFLVSSWTAGAKEIIEGERARALYENLAQVQAVDPGAITSSIDMYFGDDRHPERGRLWFTTIYRTADLTLLCYQYDYREAGVIDYLCELK